MGHFAPTEYLPRTLSKKADWEGAVKKPAPSLPKKKKAPAEKIPRIRQYFIVFSTVKTITF